LKAAKQDTSKNPIPGGQPREKLRVKPRKITKDEREQTVRTVLRKALTDAKLWGQRDRRAKKKADDAAGKKPKGDDAAMEE